ncbi:MAG: hypothetical protein IJB81_10250, partial [Clostridia bacterium]|nr:hypothetical protein [Clostridia bacterium]
METFGCILLTKTKFVDKNRLPRKQSGQAADCRQRYFWSLQKGFASAEATKGLSDRPLETFGCILLTKTKFIDKNRLPRKQSGQAADCRQRYVWSLQKGFASAEATKGRSDRPLET